VFDCFFCVFVLGNDLARVLHWGPGYRGEAEPLSLLRDVIDAEEIKLDRYVLTVLSGSSLKHVVHSHVPLSSSSVNWYQQKLGHKQAHLTVHQLPVHGLAT